MVNRGNAWVGISLSSGLQPHGPEMHHFPPYIDVPLAVKRLHMICSFQYAQTVFRV